MQKTIEKTNPEFRVSAGPVKATIWKNQITKDGEESEYSTVTLERVYKDKEGNWQSTNTFRVSDIPKAEALLKRVYENIIVKEA